MKHKLYKGNSIVLFAVSTTKDLVHIDRGLGNNSPLHHDEIEMMHIVNAREYYKELIDKGWSKIP